MAARITGDAHQFDIAEMAADAVLSSPYVVPYFEIVGRTGQALMAVHRGDVAAAIAQYAALEYKGGLLVGGYIGIDRVLGLLAQTMGNLDKAVEHFEDALAFCRKAGYRPELAWACCDYADCLLQCNNPNDRARAMSLIDESLAISRELGMRPLMERVLSRREILRA